MTSNSDTNHKPTVIALWPGGAPGSEDWTHQEEETVVRDTLKVVRNVVQPSLTDAARSIFQCSRSADSRLNSLWSALRSPRQNGPRCTGMRYRVCPSR